MSKEIGTTDLRSRILRETSLFGYLLISWIPMEPLMVLVAPRSSAEEIIRMMNSLMTDSTKNWRENCASSGRACKSMGGSISPATTSPEVRLAKPNLSKEQCLGQTSTGLMPWRLLKPLEMESLLRAIFPMGQNMTLCWNGLSNRRQEPQMRLQATPPNGVIFGTPRILPGRLLRPEDAKSGLQMASTILQVMSMNGHKRRTKVRIVLSVVAVTTIVETFILLPIAISATLISAIASLVSVPRFSLRSTDH